MRCPDCQKFVSMETEIEDMEPAVEVGTISEDGTTIHSISGTVRILRKCADCSTELKTIDFEIELSDVAVEGAPLVEAEWESVEAECEVDVTESGVGRWKKNMIGFSGTVTVKLGERVLATKTVEDSASASSFEEV